MALWKWVLGHTADGCSLAVWRVQVRLSLKVLFLWAIRIRTMQPSTSLVLDLQLRIPSYSGISLKQT